MELRHLRYFIRAAELLNFTKAAESLYVSQPTLSVQIQQLEHELGADLFMRIGRSVRLTQAGEAFLVHARHAVRILEEGAEEVSAIQGVLRGHLTIAALPLIASKMLPHWVIEFKAKYPNVAVHVRSDAADDIEKLIADGLIDLGITTPSREENLQLLELFRESNTHLFVSSSHPLARKEKLSVDDLRGLPLALPSARLAATAQALGKFFESINLEPRVELTCDDGHALIELVKTGTVATMLPPWAAIGEENIHGIPLPGSGIKFVIGAAYLRLSPSASAFCDLVKSRLEKNALFDKPR